MSRRQTSAGSEARADARAASPPITAHRLFPALVALWFAALFGLGSFVVPVSLMERAIGAAQLSALVPAAAPPLGLTARLLIAGAMTALGVVAGLVLALRLRPRPVAAVRRRGAVSRSFDDAEAVEAAPQEEQAELTVVNDAPQVRAFDAHPDAPPRKPFVLSDDLVQGDSDGSATGVTIEHAWSPTVEVVVGEGVDEGEVDEMIEDVGLIEDADWAVFESEADDPGHASVPPVAAAQAVEDVAVAEKPVTPSVQGHAVRGGAAIVEAPLESLGLVQLVERLALAIDARRHGLIHAVQPVPASPAGASTEDIPVYAPPAEASFEPITELEEEVSPSRQVFIVPDEDVVTISSDEAVQNEDAGRKIEGEAFVDQEAEVAPEPAEIQPALSAHESVRIPRLFGGGSQSLQPPRILAARWDVDADEADEAEDIVVPRFLGQGLGEPAAGLASARRGDEPVDAHRLATRQEFIREHAEPVEISEPATAPASEAVVVFPGHGPRLAAVGVEPSRPISEPVSAEDTERALRAALATLQRMTARG